MSEQIQVTEPAKQADAGDPSDPQSDPAIEAITVLQEEVKEFRYSEPPRAFAAVNQALQWASEIRDPPIAREYAARLRYTRGIMNGEQGRIDDAEADFAQALEMAVRIGNRQIEAGCLHGLGNVFYYRGDSVRSLALAERNLAIRRELQDQRGLLTGLSSLAALQGSIGDYVGASASLSEAIKLARSLGNMHQEAVILNNMGLLQQECGDLEKAQEAFARSVSLFEKVSDRTQLSNTLSNWANTCRLAEQFDAARDIARRALEQAHLEDNPHRIATAHLSLGIALAACQEREAAEESLLKALQIVEQIKSGRQYSAIVRELGEFYLKEGRLDAARQYLERARESAIQNEEKRDLSNIYHLLSDLCLAEGDGVAALTHFKAYHQVEQEMQKQAVQVRLLQESERRLQEAQQLTRIGWWEFDIGSGRISWSQEMFRLLGIDPALGEPEYEEVLGRYHPEDIPMHQEIVRQALVDGRPYEFDVRTVVIDGAWRWMHVTGQTERDAKGQVVRLKGTLQDVTERKQTEARLAQSEARLSVLIRNLQGGVLVEDEHRRVVLANEGFCNLFDLPLAPEVLIGIDGEGVAESGKDLFADPDGFIEGVKRRLSERTAVTGEPFLLNDGQHLERDYVPIFLEDGYQGHLWLYRNVTERKQAEEQLRALNTELQRSNDALQEFAHVAGHDLKEPLRKIQSFGGMLQRRAGDRLDSEALSYLQRMIGATDRMQALLDGLLRYSRVSSTPAVFEPVDLNEVVTGVLSDLETRIAETGGTVQVDNLPVVSANPLQMRQLFQNLIGNALKYRREDVAPLVQIMSRRNKGQVTLHIRDNGIGFAPEQAERMFGIFERLVGRDKPQYEGTGVGLAICKKIVERHGGKITVEGRPGEGATFTVKIPTSLPAAD